MTTVENDSVVPEFAHAVRGYDRYQVDDYIERLNQWAAGAHARALDAERTVEAQTRQIEALQERLTEMEEHRSPGADQALRDAAERTAEMVTAAVAQADEIRHRASADADRRLDEASRQAAAVVEAARQSVARLTDETAKERKEGRSRAQAGLEEARAQAEAIRREAEETARTTLADARAEAARMVEEAEQTAAAVRRRSDVEQAGHQDAVARLQGERQEIIEELGRLRGAIQALLGGAPGDEGQGEQPDSGGTARTGAGPDQLPPGDPGVAPPADLAPGA